MKTGMTKKLFAVTAIAAAAAGCSPSTTYTVTGEVDTALNGQMVYMRDYNDERTVDSVEVADGRFVFTGTIEGDSIRRIDLGRSYANLILEAGDLQVDMANHNAAGTPLNEAVNAFSSQADSIFEAVSRRCGELQTDGSLDDDVRSACVKKALDEGRTAIAALAGPIVESNDNALGAYVFWSWSSFFENPEDFDSAYVYAGEYTRNYGPVKRIATAYEAERKTREGMPFVDFTVETGAADSTAVSLSDYVGRGKYVLVDFWASWCGPCKAEIPVVREVWDKYRGDRFEVLGVAVWDKRDRTLAAIDELQIPWPQIFDAGTAATDLYGINGIPHIILFGPDGTIVARGLRGDALRSKVAEAMAQ